MKFLFLLLSVVVVPSVMITIGSAYTQANTADSDTPKFFAI